MESGTKIPVKVYLVAGEPSGDLLASGLMGAVRRTEPGVEFRGVGGESMAAQGLASLFDIAEISVMGIFEVIPRLPVILRRLKSTAEDIKRWQPDVIVTIDSWGFVSSLIKRLRKEGVKTPVVHYVAPQVWAWKKKRAKKVAQLVDRLMMLLPDEGRYFEPYGLRCDFVGHPVIERISSAPVDPEFSARTGIPENARVVTVLPGSRRGEIDRLLPIFGESVQMLQKQYPDIFVLIPTVAAMETRVRELIAQLGIPAQVVAGSEDRYNAFRISEVAIAKSGTVSLELAAIGTPHLVAYKFNALSNLMARLLVKLSMANLLNIKSSRMVIPEFLLPYCRASLIAACASHLLYNRPAAQAQVTEAQEVLRTLRLPDILPSDRAAQVVLEEAKGYRS